MSKEAIKLALETAEGIANSDWRKWEELASPEEFERWVKSRALHMATALREALAKQPAQTDWEAVAADQAMTIALLRAEQPQQEPAGWRPATFHRDNLTFNPGLPDEQTVKFWKLQGVEIEYCYTAPPAQRKPLTDEQIDRLWSQSLADTESETWLPLREFARAIEAAHAIKGDA